jgi:hypothetical protein
MAKARNKIEQKAGSPEADDVGMAFEAASKYHIEW